MKEFLKPGNKAKIVMHESNHGFELGEIVTILTEESNSRYLASNGESTFIVTELDLFPYYEID